MTKALSVKQVKALSLLVLGEKCKDVAEEVGVTPQTVSGWRNDPEFEAALNSAKWGVLKSTMDSVRAGALLASTELSNIALNAENDETRRKACLDLIGLTGISNPQDGGLGMFIGSTEPADIPKHDPSAEALSTSEIGAILDKLRAEVEEIDEDETED